MRKLFWMGQTILVVVLTSSCAIYKQEFDCQTPEGVPCTSETDLERYVIETDKGPDLFYPITGENNPFYCFKRSSIPTARINENLERKVWICEQKTDEGCQVQGHYIYQSVSSHKIAD